MNTSDFEYDLPAYMIAQTPAEPRDHSRLLVLDQRTGSMEHRHFFEIIEYLQPGDVLVLNESRVIPARLFGKKVDGGGKIEFLLLNRMEESIWESLVRPGRRVRGGTVVEINSPNHSEGISVKVLSRTEHGTFMVHLADEHLLETLGDVPLPPYIHTPVHNPERYQTVYAKTKGSVAAPTAGLHFTSSLLDRITQKGIETVFVTLHVGLGSFRPVKTENPQDHSLHQEYFEVSQQAAEKLNKARSDGRRIIAVGTTAVRSLEWVTPSKGTVKSFAGWNDLYILPGYEFKGIDALITNFHLPRSTLLMLVAAFAGREQTLKAYEEAIRNEYRFYSFGDAMLIL